jgi:multisubunit Na+/H+ antiporter MnhG subunit
VSLFDLVLLIGGAVGTLGGMWPLLTGRNFPGILGRGFTRGDNLRLQRAPAVYFRAMGATIATSGLVILYVGALIWLSEGPPAADLTLLAIVGGLAAISFAGSFAWLLVLTARYKLFRWDAP